MPACIIILLMHMVFAGFKSGLRFNSLILMPCYFNFFKCSNGNIDCCRSSHQRCSIKKMLSEILKNSKENIFTRVFFWIKLRGSGLPEVNNRNTRKRCKMCSMLTLEILEKHHWSRYGVFIVNFEHISHIFLVLFCSLWAVKCFLGCSMVKCILHSIYWSRKRTEVTTKQT